MSMTAALVGVFGTVQRYEVVFGPSIGVIHIVNVLPPSKSGRRLQAFKIAPAQVQLEI